MQELMPFKAVVVSTGGGAVVRRQNWGFLQHGVVVWLTGSPELLSRRALRDGMATRPLLSQNNGQAQSAVSRSPCLHLVTAASAAGMLHGVEYLRCRRQPAKKAFPSCDRKGLREGAALGLSGLRGLSRGRRSMCRGTTMQQQ